VSDIFRGVGIEVKLNDVDDFLKVKETLTRIGVSSVKDKRLYQSCHILHKQGRYVILHFKELFILDHVRSSISINDVRRRNTITKLLQEWGLVSIVDKSGFESQELAPLHDIEIIPYKEKSEWELIPKYKIGKKKLDKLTDERK
jgi:hypothetical protein